MNHSALSHLDTCQSSRLARHEIIITLQLFWSVMQLIA